MNPILDYETYQSLIAKAGSLERFSPKLAYCPLLVQYPLGRRIPGSTDVLPMWKAEPLDAVREAFAAGVVTWEASEACKQLRASLETAAIPSPITKIVAFACSTIASRIVQSITIVQHCLILTLRDIFSKLEVHGDSQVPEIKLFAQDPMYTDVDNAVLKENGISVLEDPKAFLEVDDSSVVLSFSPNIPVRQIIADLARPAVLLWTKVHTEQELLGCWIQRHGITETESHPSIEQLEAVT